ncbi:8831_t:CDS:2, partial [Racocetra fulgida]
NKLEELMEGFTDTAYVSQTKPFVTYYQTPPTAPETRIHKLHKKITELNNKMAMNPQLSDLSIVITQLNSELQEELKLQTEKWQLRSNIKWLEAGEKLEILQYIKEQFAILYRAEPIDLEAAEALTEDLPSVSQQQNTALIKEISLQEITETIDKLPKHKTPGPDGLTHEFYKTFRDKISPLLQI